MFLFLCMSLAAFDFASLDKGFIFNVPSVLLEVDEYQGGLGLKAGTNGKYLRLLVDFSAEDDGAEPDVIAWGAGAAFEWHLQDGRVSPYAGASLGLSGVYEKTSVGGGDWVRDDLLAVEGGPLIGVEFSLTEGVSLFAEYQILGMYGWPSVTTSVGGDTNTVKDDMVWSWDLSLGNTGMIGLCVYF